MSNTPLTIPVKNIDNEQHSVGLFDIHYVIPEKQESVFIDSANNQYAKSYDLITGWDRTLYPILYYRKIDNEIFIYLNLLDAQNGINAIATTQQLQDMITKTYSELQTLIAASGLIPGTLYKISDRGDRGIYLTAISTTKFDKSGTRIMLCPANYSEKHFTDPFGNYWGGIWNAKKSGWENVLYIWGGAVFKNITRSIGTSLDNFSLDGTNFIKIEKTTFTNHEYIECVFSIEYDFDRDWIFKQSDENKNIVNSEYVFNGGLFNACDCSDWNQKTVLSCFYGNETRGFFNNILQDRFYNNKVEGSIFGNVCYGIESNSIGDYRFPYFEGMGSGNIANNITDRIIGNECFLIANNICDSIVFNTTQGGIYANHLLNLSGISYNNANNISCNTLTGFISNNNILYDISYNVARNINNNLNNGSITLCNVIRDIAFNKNNGLITCSAGDVLYNMNNGSVSAVCNPQNLSISYNQNNGAIETIITSNVSDPIVNK